MAAVRFSVPVILTNGEEMELPFVGCSVTGNVAPDTFFDISMTDILKEAKNVLDSDGEWALNKMAGIMSHLDDELEKLGY